MFLRKFKGKKVHRTQNTSSLIFTLYCFIVIDIKIKSFRFPMKDHVRGDRVHVHHDYVHRYHLGAGVDLGPEVCNIFQ